MFVRPLLARLLLAGAMALPCAAASGVAPAARAATGARGGSDPVDIAVLDSLFADRIRAVVGAPARQLGVAIRVSVANGAGRAAVEAAAARGTSSADLLLLPATDAEAICRESLGDLAADAPCGVAGPLDRIVLGWDTSRDAGPPAWNDVWEVARLPGRRGLPRRPQGTLEIALLADGVAARDVYSTLGSAGGQDRAFRKLAQIRPYLLWWNDRAAAIRSLATGEVLMTAAPAATLAAEAAHRPGIGLQWTDNLAEGLRWIVPRTAAHAAAARKILALLATPAVGAAIASVVPAAPAGTTTLRIDERFWAGHADLAARFTGWIAR